MKKKNVIKYFQLKELLLLFLDRLYARSKCYLLQVNTRLISQKNQRKQRWELELIREEHIPELLSRSSQLNYKDKKDLIVRILFYQAGFTNCYFYRLNGEIAHLQWIIYPSENRLLDSQFKHFYYPIKKHEVMIENAFTFPQFRNLGLYPMATIAMLNKANNEGYKSAVSYIRVDRLEALTTFMKIGFKAKELLSDQKILGFSWRGLKNE